jgi:hypothetical protein
MAVLSGLCCFALKPLVEGACECLGVGLVAGPMGQAASEVVDGSAGRVVDFLYRRFRDESNELFTALRLANDRAWQSLEVALAGESFWSFLSDRTDKSFRSQVREFLDQVPLPEYVTDQADFRKACVLEIQKARKAGLLGGNLDAAILSRDVGTFARFTDPQALLKHRNKLAAGLANELADNGCETLAGLIGAVDVEDSLLVHALKHFFNREVERRPRLQKFLEELRWQHMQTAIDKGFAALEGVLAQQGPQLTQLLAEAVGLRIEAAAIRAEAEEHYLDLKDEFRQLDQRQAQANRELYQNILEALQASYREPQRPVRYSDSLSLRTETEYQLVKQLVAQYRKLPEDQRQRLPALMNAVGKLEVLSGDLDGAQKSFQTVAAVVPDGSARAEAHYNAYQAALQRGDREAALDELVRAVAIAPQYAPFPVERYRPQSILGAGGFGVAFLCKHSELNTPVVVKALIAEQLASSVEDVFREAQVLDQLDHPCIIRLRECGYTDPANKSRPYFLLNYFDGETLDQHVRGKGAVPVADALPLARLIAQALQAAHAHGILHRDVKPANVLVKKVGAGWQVKLIDFGLAVKQQALRRTVSAASDPTSPFMAVGNKAIAGTLDYAAPEQIGRREEPVGAYSDVFGFGKTLCYALFQTPSPGPRHWLSLQHRGLVELLGACLEEDPAARPASLSAVLSRLDSPPVAARAPAAVPMIPVAAKAEPIPVIPVAAKAEPIPMLPLPAEPAARKTPKPPPLPKQEEPIVLQVVDLTGDFAQYEAAVKKHGGEGERLFLKKVEAQRRGDWQTAALQGDAIGRFFVALRLEHGIGTTRDLATAAERYRLAADAGLAAAQYHLGLMYQAGRGLLVDLDRAAHWYRKAAEKGHAPAQCKLARLYFEGQGVPQDEAMSFRWYHKAAEQGHAAAQHNLAELYATGRGVPRDKARANYWRQKAAEQERAKGQQE